MTAYFAADSIGKSFGRSPVLKAASVWAQRGRVTVVLGRNGSGKSTLLRAAVGAIQPDHGTVRLGERVFLRPRLHVLARLGLFFLPDRALLSPRMTLRQHAEAFRWSFGRFDMSWLERIGLVGMLDMWPGALSTGERRKAEVALAAGRQPTCLLADEPLVGVEPRDVDTVAGALRQLAAEGAAVVATGHEVPELLRVADEVVWLVAGTSHGLGSPAEAARHDQFRREYLGPGPLRL